MERYGRVGEQGSRLDHSLQWISPGSETGLEASMWRLGLRGGGNESYPERPDEPDCIYYLRTGFCGYGSRCRLNHPPNHSPVLGGFRTEAGEFPERIGQPACQHFMQTGTCKFGGSCKYHHPRGGGGGGGDSVTPATLSYIGFPLRPGEKECSYYMRTGQCKFGSTCRFHHPVPPSVQAPPVQQLQSPSIPSMQQYGVVLPRPQLLSGSYPRSPYGYNQMVLPSGLVPYSGWSPYQASASAMPSPMNQQSMGSNSIYGPIPLSPSTATYQNKEESFPQREGEPECQYFMRTGDCKFGSSCRFHHPLEGGLPDGVTLSDIGLPFRPGAARCTHFAEHGVCKFGSACRYDHTVDTSSLSNGSESDLSGIPVLTNPLGSSSLVALAPSVLSSSEQFSFEPKEATTSSGLETVAAGVSSSSADESSSVSHPEPDEASKGESTSIEA